MGRREKAKGTRRERDLVRRLRARGIPVQRVPLSGSVSGYRGPDVLLGRPLYLDVEVKARRQGWKTLRRQLEHADVLVLWANRQEPLVVMPLHLFERFASTVMLVERVVQWWEEADARSGLRGHRNGQAGDA